MWFSTMLAISDLLANFPSATNFIVYSFSHWFILCGLFTKEIHYETNSRLVVCIYFLEQKIISKAKR